MDSWTIALTQHGYKILIAAAFLEAVGLPVPVALALLIAGAAAAHGLLRVPYALGAALLGLQAGDMLMFMLGRFTGWWMLGILCRISLNPESCILRAADSFYRHGRQLLVVAKFIPGINSMAPPLAGSMHMRLAQFLPLDLAGISLYVGVYFGVGFLFSDALAAITRGYQAVGGILSWVVAALVAGYLLWQLRLWIRARGLPVIALADPAEAERGLQSGAEIYDVRSHGYFDARAIRIQGSRRLDPNALHQSSIEFPNQRAVYLYCTCARQATSARVARELQTMLEAKSVRILIIKGGLRGWVKAGFPVEPVPPGEMMTLPVFV